jgi:Fic family protein
LIGHEPWIRWFADTLTDSASLVTTMRDALHDKLTQWSGALDRAGIRTDASARRLLALLPSHPVLTAQTIAQPLGVSERSARTAIRELETLGALSPVGRGGAGTYQWWAATDVLQLARASSVRLATPPAQQTEPAG